MNQRDSKICKVYARLRVYYVDKQQQLANKAGMDRTVITKIETGARNTTLNNLIMIDEAMNKKLKIMFV